MVTKPSGHLNEFDWGVLGHELINANGKIRLPVRRLDIPLPYEPLGLNLLTKRCYSLGEEIRKIYTEHTMGGSARSCIHTTMGLLDLYGRNFKQLRTEWEEELAQVEKLQKRSEENLKLIRNG